MAAATRAAGSLLNQIKMILAKVNPRFEGNAQCDAHELLHCLILQLHRSCNRGAGESMQYKEITDKAKKETDDDAAARWHRIFKARDDSVLTDLFTGQLKSVVQCKTCGKKSLNFDPMWELHVELAPRHGEVPTAHVGSSDKKKGGGSKRGGGGAAERGSVVHLQELLNQQLSSEEVIEGFACSNCNEGATGKGARRVLSTVTRHVTVSMLPQYLVLHLRRFTYDGKREMAVVRIPQCLQVFCGEGGGNGRPPREYRLVGTIAHHGDSADEGHYTAHCLVGASDESGDDGQWLRCDDESVEMSTIGEVCSEDVEVYMLMYRASCDT